VLPAGASRLRPAQATSPAGGWERFASLVVVRTENTAVERHGGVGGSA
jgi:hypothetical protein